MVEEVVIPFRTADQARFVITGPPVWLPTRMALPVSMAVHELAKNALRWGALSTPEGRVEITWEVTGTPATLRIVWREVGGPAV